MSRIALLQGAVVASAALLAACGGSDGGNAEPAQATQAAGTSLQEAMDSSARAMDRVDGNRSSLDQLASSLQPAISQTSDVIVLMTPKADGDTEKRLLTAAKQQRTFLQFAVESAKARSRKSANATLDRVRSAGTRASAAYASVARVDPGMAGRVPASTTFNTGRLEDAVRAATKTKKKTTTTTTTSSGNGGGGGTSSGSSSSGTTSCGDGLSVNSVTTCTFAESVRSAWANSGGSSVIEAFSPATGRTYTMTCTGSVPVICSGGNNARVYIR